MFDPVPIAPARPNGDVLTASRGARLVQAAAFLPRTAALLVSGVLFVTLLFAAAALLFGLLYTRFNPPVTSLMLLRPFEYGYHIRPVRYLPFTAIPEQVRALVVEAEDAAFYRHGGIDLASMQAAWQADREIGFFKYGGSTITQQLVRSLFLTTRRSIIRKYLETVMAIVIDPVLGKRRELELYLNYVEWGKGVYGIEAGSFLAFGKTVRALSQDEAVRLVTILPNPVRYRPASLPGKGEIAARYERLQTAAAEIGW